jgi:acyl-CoA synthetase (AMP-forming)/AMP-acid ligase II
VKFGRWGQSWLPAVTATTTFAYVEAPVAGPAVVFEIMELSDVTNGMGMLVRDAAKDGDSSDPIRTVVWPDRLRFIARSAAAQCSSDTHSRATAATASGADALGITRSISPTGSVSSFLATARHWPSKDSLGTSTSTRSTRCVSAASRMDVATTAGLPCEDLDVRVADDGQVLVRGYSVMQGYLDDPVATAEAIDADGWLHTGDLGEFTDSGRLRIVGRKKDMFIVGGFNAYPAEIEGFLLEHPAIAQAAVIVVPDDRLGQVGKAFLVLRAAAAPPVAADDVIAWSRERLGGFKVPRYVQFRRRVAHERPGKVVKHRPR